MAGQTTRQRIIFRSQAASIQSSLSRPSLPTNMSALTLFPFRLTSGLHTVALALALTLALTLALPHRHDQW